MKLKKALTLLTTTILLATGLWPLTTLPAATLLYNPSTHRLTEPAPSEFYQANPLDGAFFEGSTADDFETTISVTDPTADRTLTLPDANVNLATDGSGSFQPADTAISKTDEPNTYTATQTFAADTRPDIAFRADNTLTIGAASKFSNETATYLRFESGSSSRNMGFYMTKTGQNTNGFGCTTNAFVITQESTRDIEFRTGMLIGAADILASGTERMRVEGTDGSIRIANALVPATKTVNLTADDQAVTVTDTSTLLLTSDNATSTNRTAVLSNGTAAGQRLDIIWNDTDAGEIADAGNAALSATWTPGQYDTLSLIWTGATWAETARSNN